MKPRLTLLLRSFDPPFGRKRLIITRTASAAPSALVIGDRTPDDSQALDDFGIVGKIRIVYEIVRNGVAKHMTAAGIRLLTKALNVSTEFLLAGLLEVRNDLVRFRFFGLPVFLNLLRLVLVELLNDLCSRFSGNVVGKKIRSDGFNGFLVKWDDLPGGIPDLDLDGIDKSLYGLGCCSTFAALAIRAGSTTSAGFSVFAIPSTGTTTSRTGRARGTFATFAHDVAVRTRGSSTALAIRAGTATSRTTRSTGSSSARTGAGTARGPFGTFTHNVSVRTRSTGCSTSARSASIFVFFTHRLPLPLSVCVSRLPSRHASNAGCIQHSWREILPWL